MQTALVTVCWLQQDRRDEPATQGELGVATWTIFLPAGTPIDTGDAVQVDGHVYELVGPPWEAAPPTTNTPHHIEATAVRVAGSEEMGS